MLREKTLPLPLPLPLTLPLPDYRASRPRSLIPSLSSGLEFQKSQICVAYRLVCSHYIHKLGCCLIQTYYRAVKNLMSRILSLMSHTTSTFVKICKRFRVIATEESNSFSIAESYKTLNLLAPELFFFNFSTPCI